MLSTSTLKDFKSLREARLLLGPLTVLIGANAAGKCNAIEAHRLLFWLPQGQKLRRGRASRLTKSSFD